MELRNFLKIWASGITDMNLLLLKNVNNLFKTSNKASGITENLSNILRQIKLGLVELRKANQRASGITE